MADSSYHAAIALGRFKTKMTILFLIKIKRWRSGTSCVRNGWGVLLGALTSHLAAMPRGLWHYGPIEFGAVWRDARRFGRSRVGWVGGPEIGVEDPIR